MTMLGGINVADYETVLDEDGVADLLGCLETLLPVPGAIIECGSWRCGSAMLMADALRAMGRERRVYACDSYEGFDLDELAAERQAGLTSEPDDAFASTSLKYVQAKLRARGLDDAVIPVKGYFSETLPRMDGPFALVLVDCDLSASAMYAAETLWPRLQPGGMLVFDDYDNGMAFRGMRGAVESFVSGHAGEVAEHALLRRLYRVTKHGSPAAR